MNANLYVDALTKKPLNLSPLLKIIHDLANETGEQRTRRVIDPDFTTPFLEPTQSPSPGANP